MFSGKLEGQFDCADDENGQNHTDGLSADCGNRDTAHAHVVLCHQYDIADHIDGGGNDHKHQWKDRVADPAENAADQIISH